MNRNFQSPVVKVTVGPQPGARTFFAHQGILSKSIFFDRALNGNFRESQTHEVDLPEDCPEAFSSVLEFLYSEEYSPRLEMVFSPPRGTKVKGILGYEKSEQPRQLCAAAMRHAKIYCLADKLGMVNLQKLVLEKLRLCGPLRDINFLTLATYLLANSSDYQGELSAFLKPYVVGIPKTL